MAAQATRMGVPTHVLAGIEDPADVYRRLLVWVQSRPVAPMVVSIPGQIIAVVGEVRASMDVAASLAHQLGVDPAATHLAVLASSTGYDVPAGQLLSDVSDMAVRRQRWQQFWGLLALCIAFAVLPWLVPFLPAGGWPRSSRPWPRRSPGRSPRPRPRSTTSCPGLVRSARLTRWP